MGKLVSTTYGDALFATALEEKRLDEFFEAGKVVADILKSNEDLKQFMHHPKIIKENKIQMIEETFGARIPKEMVGLMVLMISKGRANDMLSVFEHFLNLVKEEKKIGQVEVTTPAELTDLQKSKVEQKLLETTKYESFEMNYHVDEALIGGMVIRIGDRVVDSSIRTKLYDLTRELRKVQV
jgi:F-type H+-transporting ATPase subunit delta